MKTSIVERFSWQLSIAMPNFVYYLKIVNLKVPVVLRNLLRFRTRY